MEGMSMNIFNKITIGIVDKIVKQVIKRKLGISADVYINGLKVSETSEGDLFVSLDANLKIGQDELKEIFKKCLE